MAFEAINATQPIDLLTYANTVTGGLFWNMILLAVFVIAYMGLSQRSSSTKSFAATGFLTGIVGSFLFVLGLIPIFSLLVSIVLAIAGFVLLLFSKE